MNSFECLRLRVLIAELAAMVVYLYVDPSTGAGVMAGVAVGLEIEIRLLRRWHR